jgi:hypothetical protein
MNIAHGSRALLVTVVAEITGSASAPDHSIAIAVISVVGGFIVMLVQLALSDYIRNRRTRTTTRHPDHSPEQHDVNDILIDELHVKQERIERLEAENERLQRKAKP